MAGTYSALYAHTVFSTKKRELWLADAWRNRLYEYIGGIVRNQNMALLAIGGMPDHVHLLVKTRTDAATADLIRDIKSVSSGWVHREIEGMGYFAWQEGYGAFSVSKSNVPAVSRYIENQPRHHARRGFQDEFVGLLHKHEVEYDSEKIWL